MSDKISVKPDTIYLEDLLKSIANGEFKIPKFQRDFVWTPKQILDLFDSIHKGYPIGSLLFWKTKGFRTKNLIAQYNIEKVEDSFSYILDGYQRISALFGVLMDPKDFGDEVINQSLAKKFQISFNIKDESLSHLRSKNVKDIFLLPLYEIYDNRDLYFTLKKLDEEGISDWDKLRYIANARDLHDKLHKYRLPYVEIKGGDIKSAIDIFSRINSKGQDISTDFMLSTLNYNDETGFTLSDSISVFLDKLERYNFNKLKRDVVLDCIANSKDTFYYDVNLEKELSENLESITIEVFNNIEKAIEFLYNRLNVIDVMLLPYPTQLIFITDYFRLNPSPTEKDLNLLENWFWITTYSNYFTIYSLSQQRSSYSVFRDFALGKHKDGIYKVNEDDNFETALFPDKLAFMSVRSKALQLFMLRNISIENNHEYEIIIKQSIFLNAPSVKNSPANIIIRLSSEFERNENLKSVAHFIENLESNELRKYFITDEMKNMLVEKKPSEFIFEREKIIQSREKVFVESLGLRYSV